MYKNKHKPGYITIHVVRDMHRQISMHAYIYTYTGTCREKEREGPRGREAKSTRRAIQTVEPHGSAVKMGKDSHPIELEVHVKGTKSKWPRKRVLQSTDLRASRNSSAALPSMIPYDTNVDQEYVTERVHYLVPAGTTVLVPPTGGRRMQPRRAAPLDGTA
jgi:hypothetical protein